MRRWLAWMREHVPFGRRGGGPELAGVHEPRRPRPPFRPPQAMAVELERAPVLTLTKSERQWRRLWRRTPHTGSA